MKTLAIVRKMQLLMGTALLALLVVAGAGYSGVSSISSALTLTQKNTMPSLVTISDIQTQYEQYRLAVFQHISTGNTDDMEKNESKIASIKKHLAAQLETYGKDLVSDAQDSELLAKDKKSFAEFRDVADKVVAAAAGDGFTLFLKSDGSLWAIGYNGASQLGDGFNDATCPVPAQVEPPPPMMLSVEVLCNNSLRCTAPSFIGGKYCLLRSDDPGQPLEQWTAVLTNNIYGRLQGPFSVILTNFTEAVYNPTAFSFDRKPNRTVSKTV